MKSSLLITTLLLVCLGTNASADPKKTAASPSPISTEQALVRIVQHRVPLINEALSHGEMHTVEPSDEVAQRLADLYREVGWVVTVKEEQPPGVLSPIGIATRLVFRFPRILGSADQAIKAVVVPNVNVSCASPRLDGQSAP